MATTAADKPKPPAPTRELGAANTVGDFWQYDLETTPELQWPLSISVYDKMRRQDSQVKSVMRAVTMPIQRTIWRVDPGDASPEVAQRVARDLRLPLVGEAPLPPARTAGRFSWHRHLQDALLCIPYGHMYFEQVYRIGDDGFAELRKLAARMPKTIAKINVAHDGGLESIEQDAPVSTGNRLYMPGRVVIPVNRLVAYIHEQEPGNWIGTSALRAAYKNWLIKDRLLRVQAQTIDRNGMGIPVYTGADGETDLTAGKKLATSARAGDNSGVALPFGASFELAGVKGDLPDAEAAIRYHDEQIARGLLEHFLNLGTQTGSWALGSTFADFFTMTLQTIGEFVRDTAQAHIVEDLVDINYGTQEPAPRLVFEEIGSRQAATAAAIKSLVDAKILFPDRRLEEFLRESFGLPGKDPDTSTATAATSAA